jgi:hypothetical protein
LRDEAMKLRREFVKEPDLTTNERHAIFADTKKELGPFPPDAHESRVASPRHAAVTSPVLSLGIFELRSEEFSENDLAIARHAHHHFAKRKQQNRGEQSSACPPRPLFLCGLGLGSLLTQEFSPATGQLIKKKEKSRWVSSR